MNFISIKDCPKNQIDFFTCGNGELDEYFKRYALQNDKRNLGKTFVLFDDSIIGFYTLQDDMRLSTTFEDNIKYLRYHRENVFKK